MDIRFGAICMIKKKKEEPPDYTVANMDIEGMPWNTRGPRLSVPGDTPEKEPLTKEETRGMIWLALKAALAVGTVFAIAAFLFILFCLFVWLR